MTRYRLGDPFAMLPDELRARIEHHLTAAAAELLTPDVRGPAFRQLAGPAGHLLLAITAEREGLVELDVIGHGDADGFGAVGAAIDEEFVERAARSALDAWAARHQLDLFTPAAGTGHRTRRAASRETAGDAAGKTATDCNGRR